MEVIVVVDKKNDEELVEDLDAEEPSLEDFLIEEEDDEKDIKKKKRNKGFKKLIAISIAFLLALSVFGTLFRTFSLDAIAFLKASYQLSQQEDVQEWKQSIVTVQGEGSKGTGFSISEDGWIVTNRHVIEDAHQIIVSFQDGELFEANVVESYNDVDLAFLKVEGEGLPFLELSEERGVSGERIIVIGNPLAFTRIVNEGVILEDPNRPQVTAISAPIYRGNSGSPVITEDGQVVAVVFAKTVPTFQNQNQTVGLAVPIEYVQERLDVLQ
ncbi:S1C family serine protease [Bacillus sp. FJAT-45350]|uniref:S1C family serine protease n=1 Tax=Bacillus sp. FJAT-45350 TaxID=2011014 RepID=UPI000BB7A17F|nr:serine protease [Bacillus sp. FJAT-45350]